MKSEKVKEIKKALECCKQNEIEDTCKYCLDCPASDWDYEKECNIDLFQKTLTLINELESENDRLLEQRNKTYNIWVKDTEKLKDRIAELEKGNEALSFAVEQGFNDCQKKTLKQFAERLKESASQHYVSQNGVRISDITYSISDSTINKILKECLCDKHQ